MANGMPSKASQGSHARTKQASLGDWLKRLERPRHAETAVDASAEQLATETIAIQPVANVTHIPNAAGRLDNATSSSSLDIQTVMAASEPQTTTSSHAGMKRKREPTPTMLPPASSHLSSLSKFPRYKRSPTPTRRPPSSSPLTSPSQSPKRKRSDSPTMLPPESSPSTSASPSPERYSNAAVEELGSSDLSYATHTPSRASSPASNATGHSRSNPINILSSSQATAAAPDPEPARSPRSSLVATQTTFFSVKSSQSDDVSEIEHELDDEKELGSEDGMTPEDVERSDDALQSDSNSDTVRPDTPSSTSPSRPSGAAVAISWEDDDLESDFSNPDEIMSRKRAQARLRTPPRTDSARTSRRTTAFKGSYDVKKTLEEMVSSAKKEGTGRSETPSAPVFKHSFTKLMKQFKKFDKERTAREEADALAEQPEEFEAQSLADGGVAEEHEGGEDHDKLLNVMGKAEATSTSLDWHFFNYDYVDVAQDVPSLFLGQGSNDGWSEALSTLLNDAGTRDNAFLCGFVSDLLSGSHLPPETLKKLLDWLWSAALVEKSDALAQAYVVAAADCLKHPEVRTRVKIERVEEMFLQTGARKLSLNVREKLIPTNRSSTNTHSRRPRQLMRALNILAHLPQALTDTATAYASEILIRLSADTGTVKSDIEVQISLRRAIVALHDCLPVGSTSGGINDTDLGLPTCLSCTNTLLQQGLISTLPSSTPRAAQFRRRLSLAFWLKDPSLVKSQSALTSGAIPARIVNRLQTADIFQSDKDTDYAVLTALVSLLDVGIGSGFAPNPSLLTQARPSDSKKSLSKFSRFRKDAPEDPILQAQRAHNATIDSISDALTRVLYRINDGGATNMARTETKSVMERVIQRLDLSVRCWPRRRGVSMLDEPPQAVSRRPTLDTFMRPRDDQGGQTIYATKPATSPEAASLSAKEEPQFDSSPLKEQLPYDSD